MPDARGSIRTNDLRTPRDHEGEEIDLKREAQLHASRAHQLRQTLGPNHPDTLRWQRSARQLSRLAGKVAIVKPQVVEEAEADPAPSPVETLGAWMAWVIAACAIGVFAVWILYAVLHLAGDLYRGVF